MKRLLPVPLLLLLGACQTLPVKTPQPAPRAEQDTVEEIQIVAEEDNAPPASVRTTAPANPAPPKDLLEKLTRHFSLPYQPEQLATYEKMYLRHPNHLPRVFKRAEPFLPHIVSQVEARDMPMEVALLPVVESGFNPFARSWMGAAGLWQFTRRTAILEGLKINSWYDGRLDPLASTGAALNYLQKLHQLTGDWLLALAAYNGGIGNVLKAVKRFRKKHPDSHPSYWDIQDQLPTETRHYVPQLLAVAHILRTGKARKLPTIPVQSRHTVVNFNRQISLSAARRLAGLDEETFRLLNAGYRANLTPPDGPHYLLLPMEAAGQLLAAYDKNPDALATTTTERYRIKPGDSLLLIARRFGVSVKTLKRINDLKSNRIIAGRTLLIPSEMPAKAGSPQAEKTPKTKLHTVKQGESLWLIARRYDTHIKTLTELNALSPRKPLYPGMKLKVPVKKTAPKGTEHRSSPRKITHTVRKGDSLWLLAKRYGVSTDKIKRWNRLGDKSILRPGQKLIIHLSDNSPRQRQS